MNEFDAANEAVWNRYELSFLVRTAEDGAKIPAFASRHGAEVTFQSPVTQVQLAYPIKKEVSACFGFIQFTAARSEIAKMNGELSHDASVLRFLLVEASATHPIETEKPAAPPAAAPTPIPQKPAPTRAGITTNEALEKRLEEILK